MYLLFGSIASPEMFEASPCPCHGFNFQIHQLMLRPLVGIERVLASRSATLGETWRNLLTIRETWHPPTLRTRPEFDGLGARHVQEAGALATA